MFVLQRAVRQDCCDAQVVETAKWRTFYLMEFCQMCLVYGFISEDTVNGEILGGAEAVLGQLVQHPG